MGYIMCALLLWAVWGMALFGGLYGVLALLAGCMGYIMCALLAGRMGYSSIHNL